MPDGGDDRGVPLRPAAQGTPHVERCAPRVVVDPPLDDFRVPQVCDLRLDVGFYFGKDGVDFFNGVPKPGYSPYTYPHPLVTSREGEQR